MRMYVGAKTAKVPLSRGTAARGVPTTGRSRERGLLALQRAAGNQAVAALVEQAKGKERDDRTAHPRPRMTVRSFGPVGPRQEPPDKSRSEGTGDQDQSLGVSSFSKEARGLGITAEMSAPFTSEQHPDGFRWTQTIDTNVPLGGSSSPYVDPRPNDDALPFYWTDAEAAQQPTTFEDHPSRNPPAGGVTSWQATLALNGVHKANKEVTAYDSMTYGFSIDNTGTVTLAHPRSIGSGVHRSILATEFPDWTFK